MTRIASRLARSDGAKRAFIPFITAGDPHLEATRDLAVALGENCADVLELGVPFSDPVADGPVIQRSSLRALQSGTSLAKVLKTVRAVRQQSQVPVVLFSYFNPVLQYGLERLAEDAGEAGVDGLLLTDLPPEESAPYLPPLRKRGLDTIFLASPTTSAGRLKRIAEASTGFIYLISRAGVTGQQSSVEQDVKGRIDALRRASSLPIAVGFGISRPEHVRQVWDMADAAVVGSALVQQIEETSSAPGWLDGAVAFARWLKGDVSEPPPRG